MSTYLICNVFYKDSTNEYHPIKLNQKLFEFCTGGAIRDIIREYMPGSNISKNNNYGDEFNELINTLKSEGCYDFHVIKNPAIVLDRMWEERRDSFFKEYDANMRGGQMKQINDKLDTLLSMMPSTKECLDRKDDVYQNDVDDTDSILEEMRNEDFFGVTSIRDLIMFIFFAENINDCYSDDDYMLLYYFG